MSELWLKFIDPSGVTRRERVEGSRFVIGRQPDCDLSISDGRLSRTHAAIERFGGRYEIVDLGSSNGTEVDRVAAFAPQLIASGSTISLGGLLVSAEIVEASAYAASPEPAKAAAASEPVGRTEKSAKTAGGSESSGRTIPIGLLLAAPILAVFLVVAIGGIAYFVVASGTQDVAESNGDDPAMDDDDPPPNNRDDGSNTQGTTTSTDGPNGSPQSDPSANSGPTPPPANLSETAKVEANSAVFLRKIAANDPKVFLTTDQAKRVESKVKSLSSTSAVVENLKSAQRSSGQLKALAASKNLKPDFLVLAAMAKLGTGRGDVFQTAQSMVEVLDKLTIQLGNELSDDCLLTIAAYDQGVAGETMKMRNMLQDLATKSSESSRTVRTIWFLQSKGKITPGEFDRALTFIALGTIAQNPKEFGVNAEALSL